MPTIIIHIQNEDPVLGEIDNFPSASDTMLFVKNPRKRDGKDLTYIDPSVTTVIWPMTRVNFIEVVPLAAEEDMISFVRE
jgi:hypothetical protein